MAVARCEDRMRGTWPMTAGVRASAHEKSWIGPSARVPQALPVSFIQQRRLAQSRRLREGMHAVGATPAIGCVVLCIQSSTP